MTQLPFEKEKRKIIVKKTSKPSKFGVKPEDRPIEDFIELGIINVNKPKGPTSHQVAAYVKDIFKLAKTGHSGTLDPNVTGCLAIALGRGTRIVQLLLPSGKEYVCIMHIHKEVDEKKIKEVMHSFVGKIKQLPPIKSAVKRQLRERKIYYIDIMEIDKQDILFRVGCQAGTYIRKLCHDMGKKLKVGAHMAELIRTKVGPFSDKEQYTMQEVSDAFWYYKNEKNEKYLRKMIKPIESAVAMHPKIWVVDSAIESMCHGADLKIPGIAKLNDQIEIDQTVAIISPKEELVAVGKAAMSHKQIAEKDKGLAVKVDKVFMLPGTYPRMG
tara:strand:+ start:1025 stop:2005 length:981 start_codon:yes stop_codon:yes gene_type:complete